MTTGGSQASQPQRGSSSYECQLAVANVILNRLKGGSYGDSVRDVIYARNQFSVARNGSMDRYIKTTKNTNEVIKRISKGFDRSVSGSCCGASPFKEAP